MEVIVNDPYNEFNNEFNVQIAIRRTSDNEECAQLVYKIERDGTIGIGYIKCDCPSLKGKCTKILLHQMIKYLEKTGITADNREVGIFVSPEQPENGTEAFDEKLATSKLILHYAKYGFVSDVDSNTYMTSTLKIIKKKIGETTSSKFKSKDLRILLAEISKRIETEKRKQQGIKQKIGETTSSKFKSKELRSSLAKISKRIETEKRKQQGKQQGKSGGARLTRKSRRKTRHSNRHK